MGKKKKKVYNNQNLILLLVSKIPFRSDSSRCNPWSYYNKDSDRLSSLLLGSRVHDMSFLWGREAASEMQLLSCSQKLYSPSLWFYFYPLFQMILETSVFYFICSVISFFFSLLLSQTLTSNTYM